jgi:hypothetical protein
MIGSQTGDCVNPSGGLCQNCVRTIECASGLSSRIARPDAPKCSRWLSSDQIKPNGPRVFRELKILVSAVQSRPCPPVSQPLSERPLHAVTEIVTVRNRFRHRSERRCELRARLAEVALGYDRVAPIHGQAIARTRRNDERLFDQCPRRVISCVQFGKRKIEALCSPCEPPRGRGAARGPPIATPRRRSWGFSFSARTPTRRSCRLSTSIHPLGFC